MATAIGFIHRYARCAAVRSNRSARTASSVRLFSSSSPRTVTVNSVAYAVSQPRPLVALLIDGGSQEYLAAASAAGATPFLDSLLASGSEGSFLGSSSARGTHALVSAQIPTLTNPNNVAIVCGAPASVTGICGNYFLDESTQPPREKLMNSAEFLRAKTVFAQMQKEAKMQVTILTAKDKLLSLLSAGLDKASPLTLAFSIEKLGAAAASAAAASAAAGGAGAAATASRSSKPQQSLSIADLTPQARMSLHRGVQLLDLTAPFYDYFESRPELLAACSDAQKECIKNRAVPDIYNPHISLYLLELGLQLLKADLARDASATALSASTSSLPLSVAPRFYYLSTTDYVQHKFLPSDADAIEFYRYIDSVCRRIDESGAVLAFTADHGMNSKVGFDGQPKVVFLGSVLDKAGIGSTVILPITDPYVKHHSSLGGYATIYLQDKRSSEVMRAMVLLRQVAGVYTVLNREEACKAFELPADRVGDIVVLGDASTVLGKRPEDHDLSHVPHLRSHGSMDEATVPMLINRRLKHEYSRRMTTGKTRNWHLLDIMFNGPMADK